ncbi:unnamed protein product [Meganyctiphanes norvegica]|uniref:Uncharacterized protein n=1 Tax=Meganyctiphanes norvegica TaxID=48144 RepID=A0AAV2SJ46_MEGNR
MAEIDRKLGMKIKQVEISPGKKCLARKFKKMEKDILPLKKKYEDIMPKAKEEVIRYLCECNKTLTDTNDIEIFNTTTELMQTLIPQSTKVVCLSEAATNEIVNFEIPGKLLLTLIPKPTKVVCLSEAATSEIMDFENTGKLMLNLIPHPTKVVYLSEDDLDITAEPSDNEENEMQNSTMKYENFKSGRYKISKLEKYLSYLKQHISIVASLQNSTCKNSLQEYKARKVEIKSHLQEDWMKIVKKEDIAKAKQEFKMIFNEAENLKSSIN